LQKSSLKLDYTYIGPSFLGTVAKKHNTTGDKLQRALNFLVSSRESANKSMDLHIARIQEAVLERFLKGGVVCEGLGANFFIKGVSHIINARIISESSEQGRDSLTERDGYMTYYGRKIEKAGLTGTGKSFDENDASLYDITLGIEKVGMDSVVETIAGMTKNRKFMPMTYSRKILKDLFLASRLRALLIPDFSSFRVQVNGTTAVVNIKCGKRQKAKIAGDIKVIANRIADIKFVEVHAVSKLPPS
jgi:hypothetical protein